MRILLTVALTIVATLLAVTLFAGDPFGIIQAGQRLGGSGPDIGASKPVSGIEPEQPNLAPTSGPTPAASGSPAETPVPQVVKAGENTIFIPELEARVHQLVNEQRLEHGLAALGYDPDLSDIARNHSLDMADKDYFQHVNPAGEEPADRGFRQDYDCRKDYGRYYTVGISENIYQGWLYSSIRYIGFREEKDWNSMEDIAQDAVIGWMKSPGHRENILTETFDVEGIGAAVAANDKVYITQNFC